MTNTTKKTKGTLAKVEIRNIKSEYSDDIATVSLRLTYRNLDTRLALAAGHRITANLLEAIEAHMGNSAWCAPQVEEVTSYRNIAEVAVKVEMVRGDAAEVAQIRSIFEAVAPAVEDTVCSAFACPNCGEARVDALDITDEDKVVCTTCSTRYELPATK